MKKWIALLMVLMMGATCAHAAEWAQGYGPAKPYAGVPEVQLDREMGHIMLYPNAGLPAKTYFDRLVIYLPREDVALGEGSLRLFDADGQQLAEVAFDDADGVSLRPMEESELNDLMWGGGVAIVVALPVSLSFEPGWYVNLDEGCFTAANGSVLSPQVSGDTDWTPVLEGDYGVGFLGYRATPAMVDEVAPGEVLDFDHDIIEVVTYKATPEPGDTIRLDLRLGGDATQAIILSEDNSVLFGQLQYTQSGEITGTVTGEKPNWGIVFMNEQGEIVDFLSFS